MMNLGTKKATWVTFWRVVDVVFKIVLTVLACSRLHSQPSIAAGSFGAWMTSAGSGGNRIESFVGEPFSGASSSGGFTLTSGLSAYVAGARKTMGVAAAERGIPTTYTISQNYPNPFNPSTTLEFGLPRSAKVAITAYDILGREAAIIFSGDLPAGYHSVRFSPQNLSSGVYVYRIVAAGGGAEPFVAAKKMILLK